MELDYLDVTPSRITFMNPLKAGKKSKEKKAHELYKDDKQYYLVLENGNKQATLTIMHNPLKQIDVKGKIFFLEGIWERTEKGGVVHSAGTCSQFWNTKMNGDQFEWHIYRPEEARGKGKTKFRVRCWDIDLDRDEKYQLGRDLLFQPIIRKVITDKDEKKKKENNTENRSAKRMKPNPPPMREPLSPIDLIQDFSTLKKLTKNEINDARSSYTVKSTPNLQNRRKRKSPSSDDVPFAEPPLSNTQPVPIVQEDEEKVAMRKKIEELQAELFHKNTEIFMLKDRVRLLENRSGEHRLVAGPQYSEEDILLFLYDLTSDSELPSQKCIEFVEKAGTCGDSLLTSEMSCNLADLSKGVPVSDINETMQVLESGNYDQFLDRDDNNAGQLLHFEESIFYAYSSNY